MDYSIIVITVLLILVLGAMLPLVILLWIGCYKAIREEIRDWNDD